ncbi:MAG: sulfite exporter TauE/SafE family protein [Alphaproteobacteria bacterium]
MIWLAIIALGLVAGTVGGVIGFGGSVILIPALTIAFGAKQAVPIMAVAALLANGGRVLIWWRATDWRAVAAFALTAAPGAALGARTLIALNEAWIEIGLGCFLIALVPIRRWLAARGFVLKLAGLALVGAPLGFLTGLVASTGPVNAPVFLAYGLTKGAFIGTEAASSLAMFVTKAGAFSLFGALPPEVALRGLIVGATLMTGAWLAKRLVERFEPAQFRLLIDAVVVIAGLSILANAYYAANS